MTYRILLVDDEVHICQLIQHLVNWEELGAELCGMAHDGVEAYEMIQSLHPHIVLSDIRMSGMDGIDLLEKIRNAGFDCAFILISGYRQFRYAQRAIQLGVIDYLVKPIKKKELNAAIRKSIQALQEQEESRELAPDGPHPGRKNMEVLIHALESSDPGPMSSADLARRYGVSLPGRQRMLYAKCITCDEAFSPEVLPLLFNHLEGRFQENGWFESGFCARWWTGYLLAVSDLRQPNLSAIQRQCQTAISIFPNWRVVLGACPLEETESFSAAANGARRAADRHYFSPSEVVFQEAAAPVRFEEVVSNRSLLSGAMQVLDGKSVGELIKEDLAALESHHSAEAVFAYAAWTIDAMNHALSAFTASRSGLKGLQYLHRNELLEQLYYCSSLRVLRTRLCGLLEEKIRTTREAIEQLENKPVRIIREMVSQRYMEHISLYDAAELVDLSPVYLSVLFKKETGVNFKDYVTNVRIDSAKELLRSGETINRVAERVGYQDVKYFSRLFTRVVGVPPAQYKKLYQ